MRLKAARKLGIGERTLYRVIQDWKVQDRFRGALAQAGGNIEEAAKLLGLREDAVRRKLKKWGLEGKDEG